ncbi:MAG: integrase core domain-containing protein [Candidatus Woesearchaeota archaeon]
MNKLNEKKRKWIIKQFRTGRSAESIAKIQNISRQWVYELTKRYKQQKSKAYQANKAGRPKLSINSGFRNKVIEIRKETDYGKDKIHFVIKKEGYSVSQRQIQRILDEEKLTDPCPKRRGQRNYVRYEWPISNYMWHCDWSFYKSKWFCVFTDDRSRKVMAAGEFNQATEKNTIFLLRQAILINQVCPVIVLSDKGTQFYNATKNKKGELTPSLFEQELTELGIEFWTSRRNHPQTNGKMEKWFDTMKKRFKKHPEESLQDFVKWYNEKRIHYSLGYRTPEEIYRENL